MTSPRTLLIWCPDWSVIAAEQLAGVPASQPVAVMHANRVVACSVAARAEGVGPGLRRREAQSRCPQLTVLAHDPMRDMRAFEPVLAAVEQVVAGVAVLRPGSCAVAARGPARYFGSEARAAEHIVEQIAQECAVEARAGIAEGIFAAELAAHAGQIVPAGTTREFLAGVEVTALARPELTSRLQRLGIATLGDFAALPAGDVMTRFGFDAGLAHRLAAGEDPQPLALRRPPPELVVADEYEEPLARIDQAAFAGRALAERLHDRLAAHGLACTRLGIEAVTAHGEELHRSWRHDGLLTAAAIADRVRWQLAGWLQPHPRGGAAAGQSGPGAASSARNAPEWARPTAGIRRLRLLPEGVLDHAGLQPGLWGEWGEERERAGRAMARVQGLLGPEGVVTAVVQGGRSLVEQVRWVPWGDEREEPDPAPPWPGRLPTPSPATVFRTPIPAVVCDHAGRPVQVSARLVVSAPPARLQLGDEQEVEITAWAGPWPVDERWWAPAEAYRVARFQLCLADGRAMLVSLSAGQWLVEAEYD